MNKISKKELRKDFDIMLTSTLMGKAYQIELGKDEYVYLISEEEYQRQ